MTEEEFKTRFDITCLSGLLGMVVLGTLMVKGCQYCKKKLDQYDTKVPPMAQPATKPHANPAPHPDEVFVCFDNGEENNTETDLKDIHHPVVFRSSQQNIPHIDLGNTAKTTNDLDLSVVKMHAVRKAQNGQ